MKHIWEGLKKRIIALIARSVVEQVSDSTAMQELRVEIMKGELREKIERFQQYGLTSVPLPGAEALIAALGGNRDHCIAFAVDDRRYRLTGLQGGEVAIYTDEGDKIHLKRNGIIVVKAANSLLLGSDSASDPVVRKSDLDALVTKYNSHTHTVTTTGTAATQSGTTAAPVATHTGTASTKVKAD